MEKRYFCSPKIFITNCSFTLNISKFISDENCVQRERYVFVSSRADEKAASSNPNPINHAMITKCISRSFEKAEVFRGTSTYQPVSCCCICFSIITELISLGKGDLENIAYTFAKHDKKTWRRFYVQFWNNREVVRLSWKCYEMLRPLTADDKKAVQVRETSLGKMSVPSVQDIRKWHETKKNLIKVTSKLHARDEGWETIIKSYSDERILNDDGN